MKVRLCGAPGCNAITNGSYYCPKHKALADKKRAEHDKEWGKRAARTESSQWHSMYESERWRTLRKEFLSKYPKCFVCGAKATIADHIVPHRGNVELFYNESNLQPMCWSCHSKKTQAEKLQRLDR